jgi:hypothetical protein
MLFHLIDRQQHDLIVLPSQFFLEPGVDGDETKVNGVSVGLADKWVVVPQETALFKRLEKL